MRTVLLRVTLREVTPAVLRVVDVPASCTLSELHDLLVKTHQSDAGKIAEIKALLWEYLFIDRVLDPLPGRDKIHGRLEQLLAIGNITVPQPGGDYYFYTRREGMQNQPVLYVREGLTGTDRTLLDVNTLAADGTVALSGTSVSALV